MLPIVASLLSLSGVSLVAHFEARGRIPASVRRKPGMKTKKNNRRDRERLFKPDDDLFGRFHLNAVDTFEKGFDLGGRLRVSVREEFELFFVFEQ